MRLHPQSPRAILAACLLGAGGLGVLPPARAAVNPEVDRMIAKLPDPAKWKESPLQGALDPALNDPDLKSVAAAVRAKNFALALQRVRPVAARYPTHPAIQFLHGGLAVLTHAYPEAESAFRVTAASPRFAALGWFYVGEVQYQEKRPRDAAVSMHLCLAAKPAPVMAASAWAHLAYQDSLAGRHADAIREAGQITRLQPADPVAWAVRGFCEAAGKNFDVAIADYQKAISLNRRLLIAYEWMGIAYAESNRPGDAIAPLKTVVAVMPKNYFAATQLGYCYLRAGQSAEGIKACRQAVAAKPDFSKAWDVLGLCYQQLGRKREAVDAFQHAVKTGPENTAARTHLDAAKRV